MTRAGMTAAIERRMGDGTPFTLMELRQMPEFRDIASPDPDRVADAAIQRWRKLGWITFKRWGRGTVWSLTDAGRRALEGHGND